MSTPMHAVWCDPLNGSWPDWAKFRKYGITRVYVDAREQKKDGSSRLKELVDGIHAQDFEAGLYRDPHWTNLSSGALGAQASKDLTAAGATLQGQQCAYLFDIEYHDARYVLEAITAFKKPRPTREYAWTMEPFQRGWMSETLCNKINWDQYATVIPQLYFGGMEPCSERAVVDNLTVPVNGVWIEESKVKAFYDGKIGAPAGMDGCIFTSDRLAA